MPFLRRLLKTFFIVCLLGGVWFTLHISYTVYAGTQKPTHKADAALILGAMVNTDGTLSRWLELRTRAGLELYQQGMVQRIIVTGGLGAEGYYEANQMQAYLVAHGVPADKIIVDNGGNNTYLSAQNYLGIAQQHNIKSVIAVSHYYHTPRTTLLLKRMGVEDVQCYSPPIAEQPDLHYLPREFAAFYYYLIKYP